MSSPGGSWRSVRPLAGQPGMQPPPHGSPTLPRGLLPLLSLPSKPFLAEHVLSHSLAQKYMRSDPGAGKAPLLRGETAGLCAWERMMMCGDMEMLHGCPERLWEMLWGRVRGAAGGTLAVLAPHPAGVMLCPGQGEELSGERSPLPAQPQPSRSVCERWAGGHARLDKGQLRPVGRGSSALMGKPVIQRALLGGWWCRGG